LALIPQAGVAIGLIFLITGDPDLSVYSSFITPVVLTGIFFSELVGPVCTRRAVENAGETMEAENDEKVQEQPEKPVPAVKCSENVELVPWHWEKLEQPDVQEGSVIFGAAHSGTVAGLARMSTVLAHYYGARPLAARIMLPGSKVDAALSEAGKDVFAIERAEVKQLGYELDTTSVYAESVASGLLSIAHEHRAKAIIFGYPLKGTAQEFQNVVEAVAKDAPCQVVVVRFSGVLHTERILVPIASMRDLQAVRDVVCALAEVGQHRIRLLRLMPSDSRDDELLEAEYRLLDWTKTEQMTPCVRCRSVATEARLETVLEEEEKYDLLVMAASQAQWLQRFFFGSLAGGVSQHCSKPLLMVYGPTGESS
jgi:nucleotide-binding universal stress UspA family protein